MQMTIADNCSSLGNVLNKFIEGDKALQRAVGGHEISIGLASDPKFGVPAHAQDAIFVGDAAMISGKKIDAMTEALLRTNPERVMVRPEYNSESQRWDYVFSSRPAGDSGMDFIANQLFSPWNISYFKEIFQEPLSYSHFEKLVRTENGTNPWAEVMTLFMEQYAGWAMTGQTGSLQNTMTNDVNVINGMMSANVINIAATYSLTLEEQRRQGQPGNPFGRQSMTNKQKYANYVLNMLKAYIGYYGNADTDTPGLMTVNPVQLYGGTPLKDLMTGSSTTRGSDAYRALATLINDFLTMSDNKFQDIVVAMSPEAHNYLMSMPYSDNYHPTAAMKIFADNYLAGTGPNGTTPTVKFFPDPLLKASSIFNPSSADYMVITAPEVGAGPDDKKQPLVLYGAPLSEFVFPAIPGMYNTQFKTLARVAGIFAPVPSAIKVVQGFGVQPT